MQRRSCCWFEEALAVSDGTWCAGKLEASSIRKVLKMLIPVVIRAVAGSCSMAVDVSREKWPGDMGRLSVGKSPGVNQP